MTRNTYTVTIVLLGLLLGSMLTINTSVVPTRVNVNSNNTQVVVKQGTQKLSEISFVGKSILPVHFDGYNHYYSPTLDKNGTDYETGANASSNVINQSYDVGISKTVENAYLQVDLELTEDVMNNSLRVMITFRNETHILKAEEPSALFNKKLDTNCLNFNIKIWYELEDSNTTIDNINASNGTEITLKAYANIKE